MRSNLDKPCIVLSEISQSQEHIFTTYLPKQLKNKTKPKTVTAPNAGKDAEKWHHSYIADGNLTLHTHAGKYFLIKHFIDIFL